MLGNALHFRHKIKVFRGKKGLWALDEIGTWVLILAGLVIIILFIYSLRTGKLASALQNLFNTLRFGG